MIDLVMVPWRLAAFPQGPKSKCPDVSARAPVRRVLTPSTPLWCFSPRTFLTSQRKAGPKPPRTRPLSPWLRGHTAI